jgi:hypothetical protein
MRSLSGSEERVSEIRLRWRTTGASAGFYHRSTIPTNAAAAENAARCVDGFDGWCRSFLKTVRQRYGDQLG